MERETLSLPVMEPENTYVVFVKELQHVSIHYSIKKKKKKPDWHLYEYYYLRCHGLWG